MINSMLGKVQAVYTVCLHKMKMNTRNDEGSPIMTLLLNYIKNYCCCHTFYEQ